MDVHCKNMFRWTYTVNISMIMCMFTVNICLGRRTLYVTPPKGGENRKTSESIKQQDNTKFAEFISNKKIFNIPMMCTKGQVTGSETC